jgi:hypothetical protein
MGGCKGCGRVSPKIRGRYCWKCAKARREARQRPPEPEPEPIRSFLYAKAERLRRAMDATLTPHRDD